MDWGDFFRWLGGSFEVSGALAIAFELAALTRRHAPERTLAARVRRLWRRLLRRPSIVEGSATATVRVEVSARGSVKHRIRSQEVSTDNVDALLLALQADISAISQRLDDEMDARAARDEQLERELRTEISARADEAASSIAERDRRQVEQLRQLTVEPLRVRWFGLFLVFAGVILNAFAPELGALISG